MGPVLGGDTVDRVGAVLLDGVALCLVRGVGLVEWGLDAPLHPDLHPGVCGPAFGAVLDLFFAPDPVACVVAAQRLLDPRTLLQLWLGVGPWRCRWWERG